MKNKIKEVLPDKLISLYTYLKYGVIDEYGTVSYSQEGEDMILRRLFEAQKTGFYVDVGAHHPKRFSNTHFFYLQGWNGINIEPNPEAIALFNKHRPRDINLEVAISDQNGELTYYMFNDAALNTFDKRISIERLKNGNYQLVNKKKINVYRLDLILDKYLPYGSVIDFMNIDVEGKDLNVIKSNNWKKYRAKFLLIEELNIKMSEIKSSKINNLLVDQNYKLLAKTINTLIYKDIQV